MISETDLEPLRALLGIPADFGTKLMKEVADRFAQDYEPPVPRLLTVKQVAEILNVSESTVRREIDRGALRCTKINGSIRVQPADLAAYIEKNRVE